jgi:beta-lactamase family protein
MKVIFLGTGSAIPIPRADDGKRGYRDVSNLRPRTHYALHNCPQCRSRDPRDRRVSSAAVIDGRVLIDAGPPIGELLDSVHTRPDDIVAIFLTHRHRDACGGLHTMREGVRIVFPRRSGVTVCAGHRFEAVRVPHDTLTWGYLVDSALAYFSDYSDIRHALPALRRARVAVLDGSGWGRTFPTHQPMMEVIPIVKTLPNLTRIFFTHVGHTGMSHAELERQTRALGDRRFAIAHHGLKIRIRETGRVPFV